MMLSYRLLLLFAALSFGTPQAFSSERICGVSTHFAQSRKDFDQTSAAVREMKFNAIRDDLFWDMTERTRGSYAIPVRILRLVRETELNGQKLLLILGYSNHLYGPNLKPFTSEQKAAYIRYVDFVTRTLSGRVWGFQIFNEWDWKTGNFTNAGEANDYMSFAVDAANVARKNSPGSVIVANGVSTIGVYSGFLDALLKDKRLTQAFDAFALNAYVHSRGVGRRGGAAMVDLIAGVRRKLDKASPGFPLYLTELGWPGGTLISEPEIEEHIRYLSRSSDFHRMISGYFWYSIQDDGSDEKNLEHNFGVFRSSWEKKIPVFNAVYDLNKFCESGYR
jgi:polysaccharide biosynthesis protein PslG